MQQMKQVWKEQSQPHECQDWRFVVSLHLQTVSGMWAEPAQSPRATCTRGPCMCQAWGFFAGEQEELAKPVLVQSCLLLLPGHPHLVGCFPDDAPGVPNEKVSSVLAWVKPSGEDLQGREGRELVRSGRQGPCRLKAGGSPKRIHLAVGVDTELELHSLVPTDVVVLGVVAQHAGCRDRASAPGMSRSVGLGKCPCRISPRALQGLCCAG